MRGASPSVFSRVAVIIRTPNKIHLLCRWLYRKWARAGKAMDLGCARLDVCGNVARRTPRLERAHRISWTIKNREMRQRIGPSWSADPFLARGQKTKARKKCRVLVEDSRLPSIYTYSAERVVAGGGALIPYATN